jgi:hypothetical protein
MNWTWLGSSPTEIDLQEKRSRTQLGRCVAPIFVGGFPTAPKNGQLKTTKQAAPINYRLTTRGWRYKMYFDRVENCSFIFIGSTTASFPCENYGKEKERKNKVSLRETFRCGI